VRVRALLDKDESMNHPITDKRGRVVHLSMLGFKPLCKPHTRVVFHATLIGVAGTKLCETCAERDLQARYENGER
jgi:D-Tyr-tRNAtyr deacylase